MKEDKEPVIGKLSARELPKKGRMDSCLTVCVGIRRVPFCFIDVVIQVPTWVLPIGLITPLSIISDSDSAGPGRIT